jgi:hypothetical protein
MAEEETLSCPICLSSPQDDASAQFAKTVCGHIFCLSCVEKILCKARVIADEEDIRYACVTRGKCPMCQRNTSLFELRNAMFPDKFVVEKNPDVRSWPLFNQAYGLRLLSRRVSDQDALYDDLASTEGPPNGFGMEFSFCEDVPFISMRVPLLVYSFTGGGLLQISFLLSKKAQTCANLNPRKSFHKTFPFKNCHGD